MNARCADIALNRCFLVCEGLIFIASSDGAVSSGWRVSELAFPLVDGGAILGQWSGGSVLLRGGLKTGHWLG